MYFVHQILTPNPESTNPDFFSQNKFVQLYLNYALLSNKLFNSKERVTMYFPLYCLLFRQVDPLLTSIIKSLGGMGLFLDRDNGMDFCGDCGDIEDGEETNGTAIGFGIFSGVVTVMFVFLLVAYIIRVKQ